MWLRLLAEQFLREMVMNALVGLESSNVPTID